MGNYKEKNGTTRVGDFLRTVKGVAPDILNAAGNITGIGALKGLADAITKSDTLTPEDKETALKLIEIDLIELQEITKRWESDNQQESWLPRNVRPITLLYLLGFVSIIILSDSKETWAFDVKDGYISLLETLLVTVVVAYFGSRGVEKYQKIKKK